MTTYRKTDSRGVNVSFTPKSVDGDGNVSLTPQELYGLIRSGGEIPGKKSFTLTAEEFSGLMASGGWR